MSNVARELKLEEELGKKKAAAGKSGGNVFDKLGNDGMAHQVDAARRAGVADERAPMEGALAKASERSETVSADQKKKEAELAELKHDEAKGGEVQMSHRRALTEALTQLEAIMADTEQLREIVRTDLSEGENASRILADLAFRMTPSARAALAAADHSDLTSAMVISSEAIREGEAASPITAELGSFAPIAWQMLEESIHNVGPLHQLNNEEELDVNKARRSFRPVVSNIRLSISGLAFD
jgi:hypothetical protein